MDINEIRKLNNQGKHDLRMGDFLIFFWIGGIISHQKVPPPRGGRDKRMKNKEIGNKKTTWLKI